MAHLNRPREFATGRFSWWKRAAWSHPEWWTLALSTVAWVVLVAPFNVPGSGLHYHDHATMGLVPLSGIGSTYMARTLQWLIMVLAMMLPLVTGSIRIAAARSVWGRRHRAIIGFMFGYLGVWILAGIVISVAAAGLLDRWLRPAMAGAGAFAVAAVWQLTPAKRRALRSCHRTTPIAPCGWRADRDCIRFGSMIGGSCIVSCWALMAACTVAGHGVAAMVGASSVSFAERYMLRPDQRVLSGVIASFGAAYAAIALA